MCRSKLGESLGDVRLIARVSYKMGKERQGPTLRVCFSTVKTELTNE